MRECANMFFSFADTPFIFYPALSHVLMTIFFNVTLQHNFIFISVLPLTVSITMF